MDDETESPIDALEVEDEDEAEAGLGDGTSSKTVAGGSTSSGIR